MIESQLINQFLNAIRALPNMDAELIGFELLSRTDWQIDALAELHGGGRSHTLLIELKKSVFPRDVREILWRIRDAEETIKEHLKMKQFVICVVAQEISPGAKALLENERVGYYDSGGSMFLPAHALYVYVDKPPPKSMKRSIGSVFSGRRAQVVHAILVRDEDWFSVTEIGHEAQVSLATASQVLNRLERLDWLESRGRGPQKERQLTNPSALLDAWAQQITEERPLRVRRYFVPMPRMESLVQRFSKICDAYSTDYAITHEMAAQRHTPFLSAVSQLRCRMLVNASATKALEKLGAERVDRGANLVVIKVESLRELLFREHVDGTWWASSFQIYLDLIRGEARTKEFAEHFRQERIGF